MTEIRQRTGLEMVDRSTADLHSQRTHRPLKPRSSLETQTRSTFPVPDALEPEHEGSPGECATSPSRLPIPLFAPTHNTTNTTETC